MCLPDPSLHMEVCCDDGALQAVHHGGVTLVSLTILRSAAFHDVTQPKHVMSCCRSIDYVTEEKGGVCREQVVAV